MHCDNITIGLGIQNIMFDLNTIEDTTTTVS